MAEIALLVFVAALLAAAVSDIATMTIPNRLSIALALAFPLAALAAGYSPIEIAWQCAFGAAALGVVFLMFNFNLMGGGDAKLIAAASLGLGAQATPSFVVWTTIAGGALAIMAVAARRLAQPSPTGPAFLNRLLSPERGIPYGVAIAAGAIAALPASRIASSVF